MQTYKRLVLAGAVFLLIGSRLPWISVPVLYGVQGPTYEAIEIGWEDNGFITAGIGLILFLGSLFWKERTQRGYLISAAILAALAILIVFGCFYSVIKLAPPAGFFAATDVGIYVTFIAALLSLAGTVGAVILSFKNNHRHPPGSAQAA
jgi:hypothetical protein